MAGKNVVEFTRGRLQSSTQESDGLVFEPGRRKPPQRVTVAPEDKILVSREEAAQLLSISQRCARLPCCLETACRRGRIGGRVLIPVAELRKYARCDHPERIVS